MRQVQAVMTFEIDANRNVRSVSPCAAITDPRWTTAAAACGTGHSSMVARIELSDESGKAGGTDEFGDAER